MNWQDYFDAKVLEKGLDYYDHGNVKEFVVDGDIVTSIVEGKTGTYEVKINLNHLKAMECSCGRVFCKHAAATLFEYYATQREGEIEQLVDSLDEMEVRSLLKQILTNHPMIYEKIFSDLEVVNLIDDDNEDYEDLEQYIRSLDNLINLGFSEQVFDECVKLLNNIDQDEELEDDEKYHSFYSIFDTINLVIASPIENTLLSKIKAYIKEKKDYYEECYGLRLEREIDIHE